MSIPGAANPLLLRTAAAGGYQISRSLRFNSSDSAYLSRTPASAGNRKTWTWAGWVKRSALGARQNIFGTADASFYNGFWAEFFSDDKIRIGDLGGSTPLDIELKTTQVFRDCSAWGHLLIAVDTTQSTAANRLSVYWNGSKITTFDTATYPTQNFDTRLNTTTAHGIGRAGSYNAQYLSGYLADVHFIDGQALTPSSFTEVSATTGQLIPKAYTGSFGTNGFWLKFSDNSAATATTLGKDYSGNNNNWTPNNLSVADGTVLTSGGALPIYNTTDGYGNTKGSGTRTDANSSSIVLAVPMDGTNNGTSFNDLSATIKGSGSAKTITTIGDAKTSTTRSKYYGSSGLFDGTNDYLSVAASSDLQLGAGDFCIELWWYPTSTSRQALYHGSIGTDWSIGIDYNSVGTQKLGIWASSNGTSWNMINADGGGNGIGTITVPQNQWNHIAYTRSGNTFRLFVNGVQDIAVTASGTIIDRSGSAAAIGSWWNTGAMAQATGSIQDFRIYKGAAKYTANFSVPNYLTGAGFDTPVDTPTSYGTDTGAGGDVRGNYCTWNPLDAHSSLTITNGNLDLSNTAGTTRNVRGTIGFPSSGKWYYEVTPGGSAQGAIGIGSSAVPLNAQNAASSVIYFEDGSKGVDASRTAYGSSYASGDVIGIAFNADTNQVTFYKNGVSQGALSTTAGVQYFPFIVTFNATYSANFGQRTFAYPVSGFKCLLDTSLPLPVVAKSSDYFQTVLYTGNDSTQTISGLGFSPDLVWIKARSSSFYHRLYDTIRGTTKALYSNTTETEGLYQSSYENLTAFNSDGFSLGSTSLENGTNKNGSTFAAWCWDAGSSTTTNNSGSISSQVRANASAGFSIVTYTGTGANATVGHGLGAAPSMILVKSRSNTWNWVVYHASVGNASVLALNTTAAAATYAAFANTTPTSTVFSLTGGADRNGVNVSAETHVAYCFAPVAGYSSFGSYTGNGSTDGPFVFCNFRPRWLLIKNANNASANWFVFDSQRNTYNSVTFNLKPNLSNAEENDASGTVDFLSNGFKIKSSGTFPNGNGNTIIYAAFAESPFQYARAR